MSDFLAAQWMGIRLPVQEGVGPVLGLGGFHMPVTGWARAPQLLS